MIGESSAHAVQSFIPGPSHAEQPSEQPSLRAVDGTTGAPAPLQTPASQVSQHIEHNVAPGSARAARHTNSCSRGALSSIRPGPSTQQPWRSACVNASGMQALHSASASQLAQKSEKSSGSIQDQLPMAPATASKRGFDMYIGGGGGSVGAGVGAVVAAGSSFFSAHEEHPDSIQKPLHSSLLTLQSHVWVGAPM